MECKQYHPYFCYIPAKFYNLQVIIYQEFIFSSVSRYFYKYSCTWSTSVFSLISGHDIILVFVLVLFFLFPHAITLSDI